MNDRVDEYFERLRGKHALVLGIGVSNRPLIRMLLGYGIAVTACDRTPREKLDPEVLELAHRMGFVPVPNRHPDWGISHTISLGLGKLPEMDAALFQVADQPLLRRESVGSLVDFYREHPEHIAALGHDGVRGNPCLFPARLFPELLALQGDHGGNQVIRRHEEDLLLWEVPAPELTDVDTPQVLAQLRRDMAEE